MGGLEAGATGRLLDGGWRGGGEGGVAGRLRAAQPEVLRAFMAVAGQLEDL